VHDYFIYLFIVDFVYFDLFFISLFISYLLCLKDLLASFRTFVIINLVIKRYKTIQSKFSICASQIPERFTGMLATRGTILETDFSIRPLTTNGHAGRAGRASRAGSAGRFLSGVPAVLYLMPFQALGLVLPGC
jgi:hypothetical protein